jgi:hypothetical protein
MLMLMLLLLRLLLSLSVLALKLEGLPENPITATIACLIVW